MLTNGGRFTITTLGQLTITSLMLSDTGDYTNRLTGAGPSSISNTVQLIVSGMCVFISMCVYYCITIEPASEPRDVTLLSVGAEYVNISWTNPANPGTAPSFSQFRITAVSNINTVTVTFNATNTFSSFFINTRVVEGLKPSVEYDLTIVAVSNVEQLGELTSDSSKILSFNTTVGGML